MEPRIMANPTIRYMDWDQFPEYGYAIMSELLWKPGDNNNGLRPPHTGVVKSESTALFKTFTKNMPHM